MSVAQRASRCRTAWNSAIFWPNCSRSLHVRERASKAPCASPTICAAIPMRPSFSVSIATL
jgi:hypothetical protein